MKIKVLLFIYLLFYSFCINSQSVPTINAKKVIADYQISNTRYFGNWSVSPQIENDTLNVTIYSGKSEPFTFFTDIDSISFPLAPKEVKRFYVRLENGEKAHTIVVGNKFIAERISFVTKPQNKNIIFKFNEAKNHQYLDSLRSLYPIHDIISNSKNDLDKILKILNWTHSKWIHDGNTSPSKSDAITILDEVSSGKRFPCFAYGIVLRDQLEAAGFNARTIYLKSKDAETRKASPGHVATEVFVNDLNKWVFLDGQFNMMPMLNGTPLNAVELQNAIGKNYNDLKFKTLKKYIPKSSYIDFIYPYLYYFDTSLDNRIYPKNKFKIGSKRSVMLVPKGAKNLEKIEFWNMSIDYCLYTRSLFDFYPNLNESMNKK